uniref:Uncharacterized protein n=1 Tax=Manihot esculenta TaxID=3983 RepID=A0A2C9UTR6_MANES
MEKTELWFYSSRDWKSWSTNTNGGKERRKREKISVPAHDSHLIIFVSACPLYLFNALFIPTH